MKKLYEISINYSEFVVANSEEEATEDFWGKIGYERDVEVFLNENTIINEIDTEDLGDVEYFEDKELKIEFFKFKREMECRGFDKENETISSK